MADTIDLREVLTDRIRVLYRHMKEHAAEIMEKHDRHFPPRILAWDAEGNETMEEFVEGSDEERVARGRDALRQTARHTARACLIHTEEVDPVDGGESDRIGSLDEVGEVVGSRRLFLELFDRESPCQVVISVLFSFDGGKCVFSSPTVSGLQLSSE